MTDRYGKSSALITALVFVVFALCVMMVLLLGAGVYQRLAERAETPFSDRVPAQYLSTRIRQAQSVSVEPFHGGQALALTETLEGETYITRVYLYQGYLWELYSEADAELEPEDGEKLLPLQTLQLSQEGTLLKIRVNDRDLVFHMRTGKEALP